MASLLILGAGYLGAALAELALGRGDSVVLADNWSATRREQLEPLAGRGARVATADIRRRDEIDALLADRPDRVYLLAAQASRSLSESDPDYTEETNVSGVRRVAQAVAAAGGPPVVFGSSLHVYGPDLEGEVGAGHPYGRQGDLAHLSKIYGELCLELYARRAPFDLALARLGIVYGRSPVEHARPESQTVVDKFRRLAAAGEALTVEGGGRATIGVVHIADAVQILHRLPTQPGVHAANVVAETVTVGDVARAAGGQARRDDPAWTFASPFAYEHALAGYLPA